jgi:hypothetical protein
MPETTDELLARMRRHTLAERIAGLLYVRFLVDTDDGRKAAEVIVDMCLKEKGRGNA